MNRLRKIAEILVAYGQRGLASEVAMLSLQLKSSAASSVPKDWPLGGVISFTRDADGRPVTMGLDKKTSKWFARAVPSK